MKVICLTAIDKMAAPYIQAGEWLGDDVVKSVTIQIPDGWEMLAMASGDQEVKNGPSVNAIRLFIRKV